MTMKYIIVHICIVCLNFVCGEEINLYGDAGQAYSIEVYLGHPHQKLKLLVDTGSTTLAIASYAWEKNKLYFHPENSSSIYNSGKSVQAEYAQGTWSGLLVSDFIQFPSLPTIPEVRSDIAIITQSHMFFLNGSEWQGLLGLAYWPIGIWSDDGVMVESWLSAVDRTLNKQLSFYLKLCGPVAPTNTTHYGYFKMLDDQTSHETSKTFRTPILQKRWYEVGIISIRVMNSVTASNDGQTIVSTGNILDEEMCLKLSAERCIVDSGTTNIRLPGDVLKQIVDELKNFSRNSQVLILNEFWDEGESACWPEPQVWTLPSLAIDLLSAEADNQYFTLEIPPQNYMRVVGVLYSSNNTETVTAYCYKLGLEESSTGSTVLGYTAMEGLEVLFNRSHSWIGWRPADCGANTRITGPYNVTTSLKTACHLNPESEVPISIRAAQWALCAVSIIAAAVLVYLLAPCVKTFFLRKSPSSQQISLSQAALVEQEIS